MRLGDIGFVSAFLYPLGVGVIGKGVKDSLLK